LRVATFYDLPGNLDSLSEKDRRAITEQLLRLKRNYSLTL